MRDAAEVPEEGDLEDILGGSPIDAWPAPLQALAAEIERLLRERELVILAAKRMMDLAFSSGHYCGVTRWLHSLETSWDGDLPTEVRLMPFVREAGRLERVLPLRRRSHPCAIHGTPITPLAELRKLQGASFCISYFAPEQLEHIIPLLGDHAVCMLDNGAYSAWRAQLVLDDPYWDRFWHWALEILSRVDQAVAVIPDVIAGSPAANMSLIESALDRVSPAIWDRLMPVYHLDEPLDQLQRLVEMGFRWIGIGSCGDYEAIGSPIWDARVDAVFQVIEEACSRFDELHPRVHLMRGLGQMPRARHPFSSADSTNIARNFKARNAKRGEDIEQFRARLESARFPVPARPVWPHSQIDADAPPRSMGQISLL